MADSSPFQRYVLIKEKAPCDKENYYSKTNIEAEGLAMRRLGKFGAFALWRYFARNQEGYGNDKPLYSDDFCRWSGVSRRTYTDAFNELVAQGYLVQKGDGSNIYYFYEITKKKEEEKKKKQSKKQEKKQEEFIF